MTPLPRRMRYIVQAVPVYGLAFLFGLLPLDLASAIGGKIAALIGPRTGVNRRKVIPHIRMALGTDEDQARAIARGMWENLGRTFAEYPHLRKIQMSRIEVVGIEHVAAVKEEGTPAIFFSAHLANWEIAGPTLLRHGVHLDLIYRSPNNPYVDRLLQRYRSASGVLRAYPKTTAGMRQVVSALKDGRKIGILIDQKYNQGMECLFFGHPAMTSPAFIQLARRFACPLYPARLERTTGARFRVTIYPAMDLEKSDADLIDSAHKLLEEWITHRPDQWIWLHRRWKKGNPAYSGS